MLKTVYNYGTENEPLYKANDIGKLLNLSNIRTSINNFEDDEKYLLKKIDSNGILRNTNMITYKGIKRLICSSRKLESINLCLELGIDYDTKIISKEIHFILEIKKAFNGIKMIEQFKCLNYRIDLYFIDYKLAIEEGSTMIRIGSSIFGSRPAKD